MTEIQYGWHRLLNIKPTTVTAYVGNIKKGKQQVDYMKIQNTIKNLLGLLSTRKDSYNLYLDNKLADPTTSSKTYWSIVTTFYNDKKSLLSLRYW